MVHMIYDIIFLNSVHYYLSYILRHLLNIANKLISCLRLAISLEFEECFLGIFGYFKIHPLEHSNPGSIYD